MEIDIFSPTLDMQMVKESIESLNRKNEEINKIIHPFLSEKLTKKQFIELSHVGKFLSIIKNSNIIERTESPDFIISYKDEKIGLEHQQIFNSEIIEIIKSTQKLFEDSAKLFEKKNPEYKLLANCWLKTNYFNFEKKDVEKLKDEISEYIYALVTKKENIKKPSFLDKVQITKHSRVNFIYNPGAHYVEYLTPDILKQAILKKEKLAMKYIEKSKLNRQWLLIVIGSTSPDSYEYGDFPFTIEVESNFEKIFLMEDFNYKIWEIK